MNQVKPPSLGRAIRIGLIIGLLMIIATGLAIFREVRKSAANEAQVQQMEIQLQQHLRSHK
jgi:septal ring-binding cell division protein DamX